ncbi:Prepilin peptidase [Thermoanaerobacterium thermosaccharolyticum DSM 571]|uniref:Prepilin leader peptidase/N-methyltransferase n=1 Tax=Thermoanaerobacterium thermosaccharolyticum (strain ATCC 7956 / DSM 571 / NCIMB 9385 / NCA 3814 / NCTC 13789 / WDCM 00135 / 2032) TaxID=580327 RepID=D9TQ94_THETC|nr:A24 family peptidase [Thermoanaerobacterium thermosaccharolyticum]ADL68795.1 Prepilin peptidase [Thermoanaerobacterium thermosaccharolyticum DSM 571]
MFILYLLVFIFGTIIGSFLNVVIYRLPRNESLVYPPSHCTKCKNELKPYDLVPILSYMILKGRCRYCGDKISIRYPIVELITGLIYLILFIYFGISIKSLSYAFLASLLIVITFIDIEHKIIPNKIILTGLIAGAIFRVLMFNYGVWDYIVGFFLGGGVLLLISLLSGGGMGGGDIKLMALIGLFIGWKLTISTLFIAVLLGAVGGIILIVLKIKTRKDYIPFGPYISAACIISILYGYDLLNLYIKLIRG